jgi:hypothetical protein
VRGKHNKLGEGERKVRLGQNSLPNRETTRGKIAEMSRDYVRCFTRTLFKPLKSVQKIHFFIKIKAFVAK